MIDFLEHPSLDYPGRTRDNVAESDATIAFALDFNSPGEVLTKQYCDKYHKPYIPVDLLIITNKDIEVIISVLQKYEVKTLNVAGNSIYTIAKAIPKRPEASKQSIIDKVVYNTLTSVFTYYPALELIRSGGQSGADEAGLKAAVLMGIPAYCLAPKGWPYITAEGATVRNEFLFKARFDNEIKAKLFEI
jgi:hypothetical protein